LLSNQFRPQSGLDVADQDVGSGAGGQHRGGLGVGVAQHAEPGAAGGGGPDLLLAPLERGQPGGAARIEADGVDRGEGAHRPAQVAARPVAAGPLDVDQQGAAPGRAAQGGEDDLLVGRPDGAGDRHQHTGVDVDLDLDLEPGVPAPVAVRGGERREIGGGGERGGPMGELGQAGRGLGGLGHGPGPGA
jgi:hypothetical protein